MTPPAARNGREARGMEAHFRPKNRLPRMLRLFRRFRTDLPVTYRHNRVLLFSGDQSFSVHCIQLSTTCCRRASISDKEERSAMLKGFRHTCHHV
jgi:hypothetical protein